MRTLAFLPIVFLGTTCQAVMIGSIEEGYIGYLSTAQELAPPSPHLVASSNMQFLPDRITPAALGHASATYRFEFPFDIHSVLLSMQMYVDPYQDDDFVATDVSPNGTEWTELKRWSWWQRWSDPGSAFPGRFNAQQFVSTNPHIPDNTAETYTDEIWVRFRAFTESSPANAYFIPLLPQYPTVMSSLHLSAGPIFVPEPSGWALLLVAAFGAVANKGKHYA